MHVGLSTNFDDLPHSQTAPEQGTVRPYGIWEGFLEDIGAETCMSYGELL